MASSSSERAHDDYKASKDAFDRAEEEYKQTQRAFEEAYTARKRAEGALEDAKRDMDEAYRHWTTTTGVDKPIDDDDGRRRRHSNHDDHRSTSRSMDRSMEEESSSSRKRKQDEGGYEPPLAEQRDQQRDRRQRHSSPYEDATTRRASNSSSSGNNKNETDPSIFIPFVHTNISEQRIKDAIERQGWGIVERVDLVALPPRPGKPPINRAYVHFVTWFPEAERQRQEYLNLPPGGHVPLVYEEPWFWKTMPNKPPAARGRQF